MAKEEKEVIDLENVDDLNEFATRITAELELAKAAAQEPNPEVEKLTADVKTMADKIGDLTILMKRNWEEGNEPENVDYRFGKFLFALQRNDVKTLLRMGAKKTKGKESADTDIDQEFMAKAAKQIDKGGFGEIEGKGDLGTPLMGHTGSGQYLLPANIYAAELERIAEEMSSFVPQVTNWPMIGRQVLYPIEGTQFTFTMKTDEETDATEVNPTFTQGTLTAGTYAGWVGLSDDLLQDTFLDIGAILRVQATEAYMTLLENKLLNDNNSPTNNYGLFKDASVTETVIGSSSIENVTFDDLKTMIQSLTTKKERRGCYFIMHPTILDIFMGQQDAMGRYYWDPSRGPVPTLWGFPHILSDSAPDISDDAASTPFIGFCNPKRLVAGHRLGLTFGWYDQTYYKVQDQENFFLAVCREAMDIGKPASCARLLTSA